MKMPIGIDSRTGLTHSAAVKGAYVHDKDLLKAQLHEEVWRVYGDSAYAIQKALIRLFAPQARDLTNLRVRKGGQIDEVERDRNRSKSKIRTKRQVVGRPQPGLSNTGAK